MRILELLCNPRPASFNQALAERARRFLEQEGHEVLFHDLYAEHFDPVMSPEELSRAFSLDPLVQEQCRELGEAQGLLVFHPDWWGGPPAMLKGWIDRVMRQGVAYDLEGEDFAEKSFSPLLSGKRGLVFCTTNESDETAIRQLEYLWKERVLGPCGMKVECRVFASLRSAGPELRRSWFQTLEESLATTFAPAHEEKLIVRIGSATQEN